MHKVSSAQHGIACIQSALHGSCVQGINTIVTVNDPGLVSKYAADAVASNKLLVAYWK